MLIPCLAIGALLAAVILGISARYARRVEGQIRGLVGRLDRSRRQLSQWNANLEREVDARVEERTLSARAITLQESERRAIGRDLHDSVGQALTAVRIHLQLMKEQATHSAAVRSLVEHTGAICDAAIDEVRRATARLGPAVLDEIGLAGALERLTSDLAERAGLAVNLQVTGKPGGPLPEAVEVACYRIAQEALTNVVRHANATAVDLLLTVGERAIRLDIRDDGAGYEPERDGELEAGGIDGMRERAELVGGRLVRSAVAGGGTVISAVIPLETRRDRPTMRESTRP